MVKRAVKLKAIITHILYLLSFAIALIIILMAAPTAIRGLDPYSLYDESTRALAEINYNIFQLLALVFMGMLLEVYSFISGKVLNMSLRSIILTITAIATTAYLYMLRPQIALRLLFMLINIGFGMLYCITTYYIGKLVSVINGK